MGSTKHVGHVSIGPVPGQMLYVLFAQYMYTRMILEFISLFAGHSTNFRSVLN